MFCGLLKSTHKLQNYLILYGRLDGNRLKTMTFRVLLKFLDKV